MITLLGYFIYILSHFGMKEHGVQNFAFKVILISRIKRELIHTSSNGQHRWVTVGYLRHLNFQKVKITLLFSINIQNFTYFILKIIMNLFKDSIKLIEIT